MIVLEPSSVDVGVTMEAPNSLEKVTCCAQSETVTLLASPVSVVWHIVVVYDLYIVVQFGSVAELRLVNIEGTIDSVSRLVVPLV